MFEFNKFGFGIRREAASVNLFTVYNTKVFGPYRNVLLEEDRIMYCAIYTPNGNGILEMKNHKHYTLPEHSLIFARHKDIRSLICKNENFWHFHCYWFTYTGLEIPFDTVFSIPAVHEDTEESFVTDILNRLQTNFPFYTAKADFLFANKLMNWIELFSQQTPRSKQIPIEAIVTYIAQNLSQPHLLQDVSTHFAYCEKHLRNIFKKNMGISPKQYVLNMKMKQACNMLSESSISIEELSYNLGFSSPYHFSNAFKKLIGISPSEYRKQCAHAKNAPSVF